MTPSRTSVESVTPAVSPPWRVDGVPPTAPPGLALRLFATCWMLFALHFATNTVREIYPALSLGDHMSFDVSEYAGFHPDIFELPGRGVFINNNPGASILAAAPYTLARPVIDRVVDHIQRGRATAPQAVPEYRTIYPMAREFVAKARERGLDVKFGLAAAVMQVGLMAPFSAASVVAMLWLLQSVTGSSRVALWLAFLYAFATPVLYRTGQLNQNILVAHCALFAFVLLWRPWDEPGPLRRPSYALAGALAGWCVVLDYSGVVALAALAIYALVRRRALPREARSWWDAWQFAMGAGAALAVLLGYQWAAFGSPFLPAQTYMPPATFTHHGYRGMDWPRLDLLWETAFGMRYGLFTSAPILLLGLYAPGWRRGRGGLLGSRELGFVVLFCVLFFLFAAANQYGRMQFNSGVRHIVPVTPFLFLLAAGPLARMPLPAAVLIGILATYWSWCLAMYRDVEQGMGVLESVIHVTLEGFRLPWLTTLQQLGYVANASVAPVFALTAAVLWVLWRWRPDTSPARTSRRVPAARGGR
jgi:hypothetical protein